MRKRRIVIAVLCYIAVIVNICACSASRDELLLNAVELSAAKEVLGLSETDELSMSPIELDRKNPEKYGSVTKAFVTDGGPYLFYAAPVGYNGPVYILLSVDGATAETTALRILSHKETDHYVRDWESDWFTGRFAGKSVFTYLERVKLEAERDNQIVAVTGSTVSTDAVIEGVNDCFDLFRTLDNPYYTETVGVITVTDETGMALGEVKLDGLKSLETYRRKLTIHSAAEGDTVHDFRGVLLSDALALLDPAFTEQYSSARAVGSDGYEAEVTMDEILAENNVFIMFEDNGAPMKTALGSEGALRLIILGDSFGQRFTSFVTELRLVK